MLGYRYRLYLLPRLLRPLESLWHTLVRYAWLAIHLLSALGIGCLASYIYRDSGEWTTAFFLLLCLLHAIASVEYLKHPA